MSGHSLQPGLFVWSDDHGTGRNVFTIFRHRFQLNEVPAEALLHFFADTRYRLRVNGRVAAYGPARFFPAAPEFDTVDLRPFLTAGRNALTVEVNSKGASSFDALPSVGGFVAWGRIGNGIDLATPGPWKARRADAWDEMSPPFSFAQGPLEILDQRMAPAEWFSAETDDADWPAAVIVKNQNAWGELRPRSIPMLSLEERLPERVTLLAPLRPERFRFGYREESTASQHRARRHSVYATHIFSPVTQEVTMAHFWGPHYLNGLPLEPWNHPELGNRQESKLRLREGWNFLYGEPDILQQPWPMMFSLPADAGLIVAADRENPEGGLLQTVAMDAEELNAKRSKIPAAAEELPPLAWRTVAREAEFHAPSREMAWDRPGEPVSTNPDAVADIVLPCSTEHGATVVLDFGGEFLGHAIIALDAPPGAVVDVANSENLRPDGCAAIYQTNWMINEADRFITRGGGETIEAFHPRGGRFLQITVRNSPTPVTLRRVAMRQTVYPLKIEGHFECSDPLFNWLWQTGIKTLEVCMEDAYLDCPWRERGCYTGDALVQYHVTRALTTDAALMRRCLHLFALSQRSDGQLTSAAPAQLDTPHSDYTLVWIIALRDYWSVTRDTAFVAEVWPCIGKIFASSWWKESNDGLWLADGMNIFCDAGATADIHKGESGPFNAFRIRALECAAELAATLGDQAEATRFANDAKRVRLSFQKTLWNEKTGCFAESRVTGEQVPGRALHTNALALVFGLARPENIPSLLAHLETGLARNGADEPGHLEPYFLYYLLKGLYEEGRSDLAERVVRENYEPMRAAGAWTLWEHASGTTSLCHAWSAAPLHYFSERVLGVQFNASDLENVLIAPDAETLDWARGAVPHPRGLVEIDWSVQGGDLHLRVTVPAGVNFTVAPRGRLAGLNLQMQTANS